MNRVILIIIMLFTASFNNNSKWHAAPYKIAKPFTVDSLMAYVAKNSGSLLENNYFIDEDGYYAIVAKLHALNKPHLYNQEGLRVMMAPDESCGSPILLPSFSTDLSIYKLDYTDSFRNLLNKLHLMSSAKVNVEWPTAVLYWSKAIGLEKDDNVFLWEATFVEKFKGKINILKVNSDVNAEWSAGAQQKELATIQKLLDSINATQW